MNMLGRVKSAPAAAHTGQRRPTGYETSVVRCKTVCACKAKQEENSTNYAPVPTKTQSAYFPQVVSNLLWNAASTRNRGKASCNVCKTDGAVICPHCGGARILTKASNSAKAHAQAKVAAFLSMDTQQGFSKGEWMVSNRCKTCHGTGLMTCPACNGEGFRIHVKQLKWEGKVHMGIVPSCRWPERMTVKGEEK